MEEKKNNTKGIIIGLLIGILLCVIGFCIYLLVNKSNEVKNNEKTETKEEKKIEKVKEEALNTNSELVQKLDKFSIGGCQSLINNYDITQLTDNGKLLQLYINYEDKTYDDSDLYDGYRLNRKNFETKYEQIYGEKFDYKKFKGLDLTGYEKYGVNISNSLVAIFYNENSEEIYTTPISGCGTGGPINKSKIGMAVKKGNTIELYKNHLAIEHIDSSHFNIYNTIIEYGESEKSKASKLIAKNVIDYQVDDYYSQGKQYKYTFKYIEAADTYWLYKVEEVK